MHPDTIIHEIAAKQGGVVNRTQVLGSGLSRNQITDRLRTRRWSRLTNGGYRVFEMDGRLNLVRAAVAVLPGAVVSHFSAAAIHSMSTVDTRKVSVLVHSQTTHSFPGVRVFRCHDLAADHVVEIDGLPTTTAARTVVDLAASLRPRRLGFIIDDAVASRRTTLDQIGVVLEAVARRGKPGVRALRSALDQRRGEDRPASVLESAGNRLLRENGVRGFITEFPLPWSPHRRFDLAFPDHLVAIEWDSRRWHTQAEAFDRDRYRDREAIVHGWRVLRFTWEDVHSRPERVLETVRAVLAS